MQVISYGISAFQFPRLDLAEWRATGYADTIQFCVYSSCFRWSCLPGVSSAAVDFSVAGDSVAAGDYADTAGWCHWCYGRRGRLAVCSLWEVPWVYPALNLRLDKSWQGKDGDSHGLFFSLNKGAYGGARNLVARKSQDGAALQRGKRISRLKIARWLKKICYCFSNGFKYLPV